MQYRQQTSSPVIGTEEARHIMGDVSARFVRKLCETGQIEAVRIGRLWFINRAALMQQLGITESTQTVDEKEAND